MAGLGDDPARSTSFLVRPTSPIEWPTRPWSIGRLPGGTGFQPVWLCLHRLEAGATQVWPSIIAPPPEKLASPAHPAARTLSSRPVRRGSRRYNQPFTAQTLRLAAADGPPPESTTLAEGTSSRPRRSFKLELGQETPPRRSLPTEIANGHEEQDQQERPQTDQGDRDGEAEVREGGPPPPQRAHDDQAEARLRKAGIIEGRPSVLKKYKLALGVL